MKKVQRYCIQEALRLCELIKKEDLHKKSIVNWQK